MSTIFRCQTPVRLAVAIGAGWCGILINQIQISPLPHVRSYIKELENNTGPDAVPWGPTCPDTWQLAYTYIWYLITLHLPQVGVKSLSYVISIFSGGGLNVVVVMIVYLIMYSEHESSFFSFSQLPMNARQQDAQSKFQQQETIHWPCRHSWHSQAIT